MISCWVTLTFFVAYIISFNLSIYLGGRKSTLPYNNFNIYISNFLKTYSYLKIFFSSMILCWVILTFFVAHFIIFNLSIYLGGWKWTLRYNNFNIYYYNFLKTISYLKIFFSSMILCWVNLTFFVAYFISFNFCFHMDGQKVSLRYNNCYIKKIFF